MASTRITQEAYDLAKQAAPLNKESAVDYISRVVQERAESDLDRAALDRIGKTKAIQAGGEGGAGKPRK